MGRRAFVTGALVGLVLPLTASAQQTGKIPRLGYLLPSKRPVNQAFWDGLRELGYVDGTNVVVEPRYADGRLERYPQLAAELVRLPSDVIVADGAPATEALKQATTTTPIVMIAGDPVEIGLITSLARPGANITGLSTNSPLLSGKRLELLLAVIEDPTVIRSNIARIKAFADEQRLPTTTGSALYAEAGLLMSYGPSYSAIFRRTAFYVDRILKGSRPAELPVEEPTTFELVINLKTAKTLGLTMPPSLLLRADRVME
jgi:putative ABC transport system substrate-binding protein